MAYTSPNISTTSAMTTPQMANKISASTMGVKAPVLPSVPPQIPTLSARGIKALQGNPGQVNAANANKVLGTTPPPQASNYAIGQGAITADGTTTPTSTPKVAPQQMAKPAAPAPAPVTAPAPTPAPEQAPQAAPAQSGLIPQLLAAAQMSPEEVAARNEIAQRKEKLAQAIANNRQRGAVGSDILGVEGILKNSEAEQRAALEGEVQSRTLQREAAQNALNQVIKPVTLGTGIYDVTTGKSMVNPLETAKIKDNYDFATKQSQDYTAKTAQIDAATQNVQGQYNNVTNTMQKYGINLADVPALNAAQKFFDEKTGGKGTEAVQAYSQAVQGLKEAIANISSTPEGKDMLDKLPAGLGELFKTDLKDLTGAQLQAVYQAVTNIAGALRQSYSTQAQHFEQQRTELGAGQGAQPQQVTQPKASSTWDFFPKK